MKLLLVLLTLSASLFANPLDELDLLSDLNNASEISTKTKLNINKTPSIISVLHAKELKKLGITNLFEALKTVPGIQTSIGNAGAKQINMRGNKSLLKDKIKLMIDGTNVNNELTGGGYYPYLDMPLEIIERIEIIRGPASSIYGSQAHVGVINIITKSSLHKKNIYFLKHNSKGQENIGFTQNIDLESIKISLDGYFTSNKSTRDTGAYVYANGVIHQSTSYEDYINHSLGAKISIHEDLSFLFRFTEHDTQNYYGYGDWPIVQDPKKLQTTSNFGEVHYTPTLSRNLSLDLRAGYKEYTFEGLSRLRPLTQTLAVGNDLIGDGYVKEGVIYNDSALKYTLDDHNLLFGVYLSESQQIFMDYYFNDFRLSSTPNILNPGIKSDISRYQYAFYFNDIYNISEKFVANIGLRYDNYNDIESNMAHKLALVYNKDEQQTYKLMYQRSFRVPSWLELYGESIPFIGDPSLKSEIIDTVVLAYNYQKRLDTYFNINIFYSKMKNYINSNSTDTFLHDTDTFFNDQDMKSYGSEIEFKIAPTPSTSLQLNYSYVDTEDSHGNNVSLVANHVANAMLIHTFNNNWSMGSYLAYIGKKSHDIGDTRPDVPDYLTFDQAVTYKYEDFSIQLSVKNLFDQEIIDPSPLGNTVPMNGANYSTSKGTYINDYRRDGRTFWISAQWSFE